MASSSSSAVLYGVTEAHLQNQMKPKASSSDRSPSSAAPPTAAPQKKKRSLPGMPRPDAEVIALSPKTLQATNRFICEVCNKGFQREQNLQLHRRGHNLPWKLRQKSTTEVKRRVYVCPEPTCVHHDPSRALGDLTGIKKHFSRKHGEKKWKCEKCSKRYAVQSDWKAHSKTCGTREYRCDCGTLFSRRDSFITHRAFCDVLAQESAVLPSGLNALKDPLYAGNSSTPFGLPQVNSQFSSLQESINPSGDILRLGGFGGDAQFSHFTSPSHVSSSPQHQPSSSSAFFAGSAPDFLQSKSIRGLMQLPELNSNTTASLFHLGFFSNASCTTGSVTNANNVANQGNHLPITEQFRDGNGPAEAPPFFSGNLVGDHVASAMSLYNDGVLPQMSATALLQKASQIGATTDGSWSSLQRGAGSSSSFMNRKSFNFGSGFGGESSRGKIESETHLQDLMNSLANENAAIFGGGSREVLNFGDYGGGRREQEVTCGGFESSLSHVEESKVHRSLPYWNTGVSDGLTRDFLGVGSMVRSLGNRISRTEHNHDADISVLESGMNSSSTSRSFTDGNIQ